jgi:hypothetical protein
MMARQWGGEHSGMQSYFQSVAQDSSCAYCTGRRSVTPLPKPLDAVYCISLQEQALRTQQAIAHFHRIGLCQYVTLYRPTRGKNRERSIWETHQALARHALANGRRHVLMLEDDVDFRQPWSKLAPRIERAIAKLPADWWSLYLGHVPIQAYFTQPNILRVRSLCAHAYVASPRLLAWLDKTDPLSPEAATWPRLGESNDCAMANLPGMYALFPMAVLQRFLGDYRVNSSVDTLGRRRSWRDIDRWRYYFIFGGARVAEGLAVLLSPFHQFTLERFRKRGETRVTETASFIRGSGLFDIEYYLRCRPDVAAQEKNPLRHYLYYGAREGAWPSPLFDPQYYSAQGSRLGDENPLSHFVRVGAALGRKPHPLFDTCFYTSRYAALIPKGMNPLAHFLGEGGMAGCDPHPLFDSKGYLAQNPELRQRRQNPLVHYLTDGWRAGAIPHPQFDGDLYLQHNPDVKAAGINPLEHFVRYGQVEGRAQPLPAGCAKVVQS